MTCIGIYKIYEYDDCDDDVILEYDDDCIGE